MKSIIRLSPENYGISTFYVILAFYISTALSVPPCGLYGAPPCQFLPAPPGQTPSCARPGQTYCEYVKNYPTYLIKHLVHKWGYEAKNLIVDETWEDFAATTVWPESIPVFYDPLYIFPPKQNNHGIANHHHHNINNNNNNNRFIGYNYATPNQQQKQANKYYTPYEPSNYFLNNVAKFKNQFNPPLCLDHLKAPPNYLNRSKRDLALNAQPDLNTTTTTAATAAEINSRDVSINLDLLDIMGVSKEGSKTRQKRQSPGRSALCQTTSQFITPQAALNNKGNWMFVVNEANTARQQVRAELCASNTCSNLCELPNGYNSRCEQKFVQKRLIALQGNGQNLYADTFWFPSCCICTISVS